MLNRNAKFINNRLALRPPQTESLERFNGQLDKNISEEETICKNWN